VAGSKGDRLRVAAIASHPWKMLAAVRRSNHRLVGLARSGAAARPGGDVRPRPPAGVEALARRWDVPFFALAPDGDRRFGEWLRSLGADLLLVAGMNRLLGREAFAGPPLGAINVHPSYLPEYRGPDPIYWQYHDMAENGGVTIHCVDEREDRGDILCRERFPIARGAPMAETMLRAFDEVAPSLLLRTLDRLAAGTAARLPQPAESPTRRARRVSQAAFLELLGWESWSVERVWHVLRGNDGYHRPFAPPPPWIVAFDWRIGDCEKRRTAAPPGTIRIDRRGWYAAHREGRIRLEPSIAWKRIARRLAGRHVDPGRRD
jgi:methionyl-tRNA formyltransferase